ncbi:hypothetical protein [Nonomuraea wenchangensis]|uniref:Uncharacterized protein n=1 Tax=Nonomuraea wenchangensis TaxID=568860 RepID=A0A1I0LU47_9ACTN|nr:hypothetical protein [Nonomuraea wenchangensis]SEU46845.1 hypothetical protein SAMN05421811_127158 [Nonomuraea wenchangensis]
MGKYDQQNEDLHTTLTQAGIAARIDYDGDEHEVTVELPTGRLIFDPTDDGAWRLDIESDYNDGWVARENVLTGIGVEYAAPVVEGLLRWFQARSAAGA